MIGHQKYNPISQKEDWANQMNKNDFKKYIYWSDELASGLSSTS